MIARYRTRDVVVDVGVVVALLALGAASAFLPGATQRSDPFSLVSMAAVIVPLLWRRRYPSAVLVVSVVAYFGRLFLGLVPSGALNYAELIVAYSVSAYEARPRADWVRVISAIVISICFLLSTARGLLPLGVSASSIAVWLAAALFGEAVYVRGRYEEALKDQARRAVEEQAERDRRAIQDERARIAREFHDIWAHTLSVVVVQAEAAEEVFDESPALAREALGRIRRAGRGALTEVRRLIASDMTSGSERLSSVPTLDDLGDLAEELRASGMPVTLSIDGAGDSIPPDVHLSAYRIVQQALTNALTHGGPGVTAKVDVRVSSDEISIDVVDDGHRVKARQDPGRQGRGLIGMRERAALFGGTVDAGPEPGGGFGVHARIPIPQAQ